MEVPDSDTPLDANSSVADSIAPDSSSTQIQANAERMEVLPARETSTSILNDDDSASDVSMSTDSEDEHENIPSTASVSATPTTQLVPQPAVDAIKLEPDTESSKKRKHSEPLDFSNDHMENGALQEVRKRIKSEPEDTQQPLGSPTGLERKDKSLLPAEIWHQIFTFCPPKALGASLRVNKTFNAYLDASSGNIHGPPNPDMLHLSPDDIDDIWKASRHLYLQGTPSPLSGKSELDMWKLACGSLCQFCGKKRQTINTMSLDQWRPGPGENGVVPVWSFGVRACGSCIHTRSTKEIDLLLSSSIPSPLMAALPFVFFTSELHVIPAATLHNGAPSGLQIAKHFYNPHIEEIKQEFEDVKAMGSAAAEEWLKGLDSRGKERKNDAQRWERWAASGGLDRMSNKEASSIQIPQRQTSTHSLPPTSTTPAPKTSGHMQMYPVHNGTYQSKTFQGHQTTQLPLPLHTAFVTNPSPRFDSPSQNGFGPHPARPQPRHERTKEEVLELKAARRAEIERRCLLLNPPITSGVLAHMASFQAAIQIIQPLDDGAWEVLKPRLLSQKTEAEQRENDRVAQTRVVQERIDERRFQEMQAKSDSKDLVDREWDDIQGPLRARIGGYADETIRDGWNGGEKVDYETAPQFAAEVLIYVRKRFYAEIAKDEAAIRAAGREPEMDPPNGPYTRKLVLENMKWVFDTKVKPHTEPYRKELFLCNACEFASKYYGFEGVIQHFAAKHTSALSVGSVVVHWKSEWPEFPPFHPDPNNANVGPYYTATTSASVPYAGSGPSMQQNFGYGGYQPAPVSAPISAPSSHVYQESPGPYFGHPQFGEQYTGHQNGPYAPPPGYPEASQGYQSAQYANAPPPAPLQGYNDPSQDYSQQTFGGQYQPAAQNMYSSSHSSALYPVTAPAMPSQQPTYAHPVTQYGQTYNQQSAFAPNDLPQGSQQPQRTEEYKAQLQQVARDARDVWNTIGNVKEKDIPGALKVYTIIYHVLQRFRATFQEDVPLAMLVDGLSNNKDMRPVRNINGLVCKACSLGMAGSSAPQKKRFSFPQLVNHFNSVHEKGISSDTRWHVPDWTKDMVDLPDMSDLRLTSGSPGMDQQKLELFKEALPELFVVPAPRVVETSDARSNQRYESFPDQDPYQNLESQDWAPPSLDNHESYYSKADSGRPSEAGSVTYESGEYDPRHPGNLVIEPRQKKAPRRKHRAKERDIPRGNQASYRREPQNEEPQPRPYEYPLERSHVEHRPVSQPSRALPPDDYERVIVRDEAPIYMDRPVRYRDPDIEYRTRREARVLAYDEPEQMLLLKDYRPSNSQAYRSNGNDITSIPPREQHSNSDRLQPAEDAAAQQNRIFEVVAQISKQAQQARERQPIKEEAGSEDGEVRADPEPKPANGRLGPAEEASKAAERFLNNFLPGDTTDEPAKKNEAAERRREDEMGARWEDGRGERVVYQTPAEPQRRVREEYDEDRRMVASNGRLVDPGYEEIDQDGYIVRQRIPAARLARVYAYEDRYANAIPEAVPRGRSPELVDRRYKLNNAVYRDERQGSHGTHRTPSRYARYESVRLENDRARSRSPVYVKMGAPPAQYRERTPGAPALRQEPIYRTRTPPPAAEELAYERAPRQEYYRVFADEPRPREPQYAEAFEYVRVSDPQGDYMIRRPVRREPEPIYAYEDEAYARQPVYESRAPPTSRAEPAVYEEYDPRHPEPPSQAPVRQVRYQ